MSISNKALLVNLSISQWIGKRIDKRATETVTNTHAVEKKAGNYTKKLLPGAKELDDIHRIAGNIRVWYYQQTLPWASDGSRILKSTNYMDFTAEFRKKKAEFDTAVNNFFFAYPSLKAKAPAQLGSLYDESEYPNLNELQDTFNCEVTFLPVPDVSDFRVELSQEEKDNFVEAMQKVETEAVKECYSRLKEVVEKAVNKLSEPEAVFRDSLIDNIQDICQLLPKLNVTDDAGLETIRKEIERTVATISPNRCREDLASRTVAAEELDKLMDKMSAFMR